MPNELQLAFIGLGTMGFPMAGFLAQNGYAVSVYNRTPEKAKNWVSQFGGSIAYSPAEAASNAHIVFICVGNDDDVRNIVLGNNGLLNGLSVGSLIVDHTTTSAQLSREMAEASQNRNIGFIDAPVSGGKVGAERGQLTIMVGGHYEDFNRAEPLLKCYGRSITYIGPVGSGQLCKMVNQICAAGVIQALAEGLQFGQAAGLDMDLILSVISKGTAQSWQMDNRAEAMLKGEFGYGFAADLMRKDLFICLDEAKRNGSVLPTIALISQLYSMLHSQGKGHLDFSSLITLLSSPNRSDNLVL
jgi:3-hydroxyisobutyrate dehydrogenase-like beta-hydroxyacid dehydrogenase